MRNKSHKHGQHTHTHTYRTENTSESAAVSYLFTMYDYYKYMCAEIVPFMPKHYVCYAKRIHLHTDQNHSFVLHSHGSNPMRLWFQASHIHSILWCNNTVKYGGYVRLLLFSCIIFIFIFYANEYDVLLALPRLVPCRTSLVSAIVRCALCVVRVHSILPRMPMHRKVEIKLED